MNTTTTVTTAAPTAAARSRSSLAASVKFKNFAVTFAIGATLMYLACEWFNLPAFTYHPATGRIDLGWAAGRSGEGPAMYWYGWTTVSLGVGFVVGLIGMLLPESIAKRFPLFLIWLLPILIMIPLAYSLMPFWTK
jgi:hypothetical protein